MGVGNLAEIHLGTSSFTAAGWEGMNTRQGPNRTNVRWGVCFP